MALVISYTFITESGLVTAGQLDANFAQLLNYFNTSLPAPFTIAPTAGVALTLTAAATTLALDVNASAGAAAAGFVAPNTTGESFGVSIQAGTNASDYALKVSNAAVTVLWQLNGLGTLNQADATSVVMGVSTGNTGSVASNTPTGIYSPTATAAVYLVSAALAASASSAIYMSTSLVACSGGILAATALLSGSGLPITVSGGTILVAQLTGTTQAAGINYNIQRLV